MAKRPASRYGSALELARALQQVEIELQLAPTNIDVLEAPAPDGGRDDGDDDGRTRIRSLVTIAPQTAPTAPTGPVGDQAAEEAGRSVTQRRTPAPRERAPGLPEPRVADTVHRPVATPAAAESPAEPPASRRRTLVLAASAVVVLGLAGAGAVLAATNGNAGDDPGGAGPSSSTEQPADPGAEDALVAVVPTPVDLVAAPAAGGTTFSWANPDEQPGDAYLWGRTDPGADPALQPVSEPHVTVQAAGRVCIRVLLRRADGQFSAEPAQGCTP
jgi:hypothetical protein